MRGLCFFLVPWPKNDLYKYRQPNIRKGNRYPQSRVPAVPLVGIFDKRKYQLKMLNIPSTINDPKYRYRMPKMQLKIESKGNGIKTNIVNLGDVAIHLRTNAEYILKWFGNEKASQTTFKEAGGKNNTNYIINGDFSEEDLRKVLDKFIEKYICCPKCKLPEMHMQVVGDRILGKCDSCPFVGDLDNKHRLAAFIIKKPPVAKSMANGKVVLVESDKPAAGKAGKGKGKGKARKGQQEQQKEEKQEDNAEQEQEEVQEVVTFDTDKMQFGSEELEKFGVYVKKQLEVYEDEDFDIKSAKIVSKIKPLGLKKPLIGYILFKAFFTVNISKQVAEHSKLYLNLMKKLIQTNTELDTLLNIEYLFLEENKTQDFSKFLPTIIYNCNKEGLLSEEFLLKWFKNEIQDIDKFFFYNAARDADFKKAVQPYLETLEEDDEEEEEATA